MNAIVARCAAFAELVAHILMPGVREISAGAPCAVASMILCIINSFDFPRFPCKSLQLLGSCRVPILIVVLLFSLLFFNSIVADLIDVITNVMVSS
jgi:hypothetical protein